MRILRNLLTAFLLVFVTNLWAEGKATHVVVIVWDGMRPDFMTQELTPTLYKMAHEGATFKNHHPVYISTTEVNGTAIATGTYPGVSGVVANREFRPLIDPLKSLATEAITTVRKGDKVSDGHYLNAMTMAETLQSHGLHTAVAGTKQVALLQDRSAREESATNVVLFEGVTLPKSIANTLTNLQGKFPPVGLTKTNRDWWTANALINTLWTNDVPALSVLWLAEPDFSQHATAPGSEQSLSVIRNNDAILAHVLETLEKKNLRDKTDVIVVSDHGFSTVGKSPDLVPLLNYNGFSAFTNYPTAGAKDGDILVIGGATSLFYVHGHDQARITKLAHFLQSQSFSGVVITREPVEGCFTLADVKGNSATAPDIMVSMRWTADKSPNGTPGILGESKFHKKLNGSHGSLSYFDMHNICFAAGPDFLPGIVSLLPSGNVDVAPTVLWILGVEPKNPLSGRVLSEALTGTGPKIQSFQPHHLETTYRGDKFVWKQYLNFTEVNGTVYFDEGNGSQQ